MIDTHCHLNFPQLAEDLEAVLARAQEAGVDRYIVPGTSLGTSTSSLELHKKYPSIYGTAGLHPTDAGDVSTEDIEKLKSLARADSSLVSIGEVGLDYYHFEGLSADQIEDTKERQKDLFIEMIELAKELKKPLIIHSRDCFSDIYAILRDYAHGHPTVIHCFTGTQEEAQKWLNLGCHLSFTGIITYKKNDALREVVKMVPIEKMMLETDAPYLAPEGFRGQICEPLFVANVARCVAEIKGMTVAEVDRITTHTAEVFFGIA